MTALKRAYASAQSTPLLTVAFEHPGLTGGAIYLARSHFDINATLEDSTPVVFQASGMGIDQINKKSVDTQELNIQVDNVSLEVWNELRAVITLNRTTQTKVVARFRTFINDGLYEEPIGPIYALTVKQTEIDSVSARFRATYAPIPDLAYPRTRYYQTDFPGVKYAR